MRPSPPILQCLRLVCLLSRFFPRVTHIQGIYLARLRTELVWSRYVIRRDRAICDHRSRRYHWSVKGHSQPPFIWCLPIRQEMNVSQIAVTFHGIRPPFSSKPDRNNTADVPSFTLRTARSVIPFVCDLCGVDPGEIFTGFAKFQGFVSVNDFRLPCWFQELH